MAAWLRLERCAGIGPRTAAALLGVFGSPDAVFAADFAALAAHVSPAQARALLQPPADTTRRLLDATLAWLDQPGNGVVALGEPGYPELLSHIPDPPLLLYIRGRATLLARPGLAIVGSRNASVQGRMNAQAFAQSLSAAGLCIVSGLALGIDAAAHEGALRRAGGTVAVVGTGPDVVYPARNRALGERIAAEGCIVSEYPIGTPPVPGNFPRRNRIISGLAAGVLVVEAAAQSGSLITARQAAEQGRDVFAIPGSIHAALAKGCHVLIREGAKLVDTAHDVLEALASSPLLGVPAAFLPASVISLTDMNNDNSPTAGVGTPAEAALLDVLGHDPVDMDALLARLGCPPGELSAQLLVLELAGRVERLPGGLVQRIFKR
nr:DNA-processing protein DprA [Telluria antibiotica]